MSDPTPREWLDGEFFAAAAASVPLLSHGLHYGTAVFEGARVYDTPDGPALFRYREHLDRLYKSASLYRMTIPYSQIELEEATRELVVRSGLRECYVRPIAFPAEGAMTIAPAGARVRVGISIWEWGAYLGDEGKLNGVRAMVSSWNRLGGDSVIPLAKTAGHYVSSVLAKQEATAAGFEEAILLDSRGFVSEGTGENLFLLVDHKLVTPAVSSSILDGITRRSVIQIAHDLGLEVVERDVSRGELYLADELFATGTAAELTPIREVDCRAVGDGRPGPVTVSLQRELDDAMHGRSARHGDWSESVTSP